MFSRSLASEMMEKLFSSEIWTFWCRFPWKSHKSCLCLQMQQIEDKWWIEFWVSRFTRQLMLSVLAFMAFREFLQAMKIIFSAMKKFSTSDERDNSSTCVHHTVYGWWKTSPPASNRALNKPTFCVYFVNILIRRGLWWSRRWEESFSVVNSWNIFRNFFNSKSEQTFFF